jgi:hypothetical protein
MTRSPKLFLPSQVLRVTACLVVGYSLPISPIRATCSINLVLFDFTLISLAPDIHLSSHFALTALDVSYCFRATDQVRHTEYKITLLRMFLTVRRKDKSTARI